MSNRVNMVLKGALGVSLLLNGCTGTPPAPASPGPNASSRACPVMATTIPREGCPGMRFTNVSLTCGGAGDLLLSISTTPGGANHFVATLANGSSYSATAIPVDPFCNDLPGAGVQITFGVQYTADQGTEVNAPSTPCITQSKAVFTQFVSANPLIAVGEGMIKNSIHQRLDDTVIMMVYNRSPSRCARWRLMP